MAMMLSAFLPLFFFFFFFFCLVAFLSASLLSLPPRRKKRSLPSPAAVLVGPRPCHALSHSVFRFRSPFVGNGRFSVSLKR
uniref:Uncharacterized protein n=1 Tax=Oryza brachyantha TaxID=4533 RepID=J3ME35_ORYBR